MKKRVISMILALGLLITSASALTAEQAGDVLSRYYIDEVPASVLEQPSVEEMLAALGDPYTDYYTAEEYAAFKAAIEDTELVGIGIRAYYLAQGVLLAQVAPDSPAEEAGLQVGDHIVAVDGHDTRGAAEADIDRWLHGEEGTTLTAAVLRGEQTFDVTMERRLVVFPTTVLEKIEGRVGWITCDSFGSKTFLQFYDIITAHDDEVDEWVIDLRENGGGDILAALFSAGCFAGTGQGCYLRDSADTYYGYLFDPQMIVSMGYYSGELTGFDENGYLTMDTAHVLVSGDTASAAELFCGVIRDSGAGLIIGERTFGKGIAQTMYDAGDAQVGHYFTSGDAMKVTTEKVYSTAGATFHQVGILPHFAVDADRADELAALLLAPVAEGEEVLYFNNLSSVSRVADNVMIPLSRLQAEENAAVVELLFASLPATAYCLRDEEAGQAVLRLEDAAQLCGVPLRRSICSDSRYSYYEYQINALSLQGIVHGVGDGRFLPEVALDRASLCALLAKALRLPLEEGESLFADVDAEAWYAPYVNAMARAGLVEGAGGLFYPAAQLSYQEFAVILGRTAQWLNMDYYELAKPDGIYGERMPKAETLAELYPEYAVWAREMVWLCDGEIAWTALSGTDPEAVTTRGEAAASLYNLLSLSGTLPT